MKKRHVDFLIPILIICSGFLAYATLSRSHNWGGDFAGYIMQAKSILDQNPGKYIEDTRFMIYHSNDIRAPVAFPWGVPLLLSPLYAVFGLNIFSLKYLNLICYILFLVTLWIGMRNRHSDILLLMLLSFFIFNPYLLSFLNDIGSDIPFLLFSTISILLIGRVIIERDWIFSETIDHILLGFFLSVSSFTRSNGVLLVLTLAVTHLIKMAQGIFTARYSETISSNRLQNFISHLRKKFPFPLSHSAALCYLYHNDGHLAICLSESNGIFAYVFISLAISFINNFPYKTVPLQPSS